MAVVTGATGGLGYETALALGKAEAQVVLTGRDDQKGQAAAARGKRNVGFSTRKEAREMAAKSTGSTSNQYMLAGNLEHGRAPAGYG